jgi:hypothetical protein
VQVPGSTLHDVTGPSSRLAVWGRRLFLLLILAIVVAGLSGLLGVRDGTVSSSGAGYSISLNYPRIARAGLDVPWQVTVTHPGGFDGPVTLAVTGDYFDIFEAQGITPQPSDETQDDSTYYLTFTKPPGDTLVVAWDIYVQPSSQRGRGGTLSVVEDGQPVASVNFTTRLLP